MLLCTYEEWQDCKPGAEFENIDWSKCEPATPIIKDYYPRGPSAYPLQSPVLIVHPDVFYKHPAVDQGDMHEYNALYTRAEVYLKAMYYVQLEPDAWKTLPPMERQWRQCVLYMAEMCEEYSHIPADV